MIVPIVDRIISRTNAGRNHPNRWQSEWDRAQTWRHDRGACVDYEDIPAGRVIVSPPRTLRPQDIAACCSAGLREIDVTRIRRVGILATGDELVPPTATPSIGQIIDSNSLLLRPLIERDGGQAMAAGHEQAGILPDNDDTVELVSPRGASNLSSTVTADGFVLVPEEIDCYEAGRSVEVHFYGSPHL